MLQQSIEFQRLHQSGCFIMPNPWDRGSAIYLAQLGFKALATTSAGLAWSYGRPDNGLALEQALTHLTDMAQAVSVPLNADFEGGYAVEPAGVATNVGRAAVTGVAGLSIEDSTGNSSAPLFELPLAVERVKAARAAIDAAGTGVLLTCRSEGFFIGRPDIKETIKRLEAYAPAGADCLFAPGIRSPEHISAVVRAVAPKPVNLLINGPWLTLAEASSLGVRRISVGGALARAAWTTVAKAATEMAEQGTFSGFNFGPTPLDLNRIFAKAKDN